MTREEAIERMKTMRWEHATNPCPNRTAFDMAISALSENNVLDKIRAEIEKPLHVERCFDTADAKAQYIALNWCIEIINKYKAESEE